jgi:DNA-damage-inducible protein J
MKAITVRVDENIKKQAEEVLDDIGLNLTTFIGASLRAVVREKRVPFDMVSTEYLTDQIILEKLTEAQEYSRKPDAVKYSKDEFFSKARTELL